MNNNNNLDLFEKFVRLEWLLRRYHLQNLREYGPMGAPHRGQGRVLALLKLTPEISQKELSNILDMRSQSLGELLVKLERSGYITRTPSETDRRVMDIRLTEAGREAAGQDKHQPDTTALFECLNEEEQANLSDYLGRIILTLEQQFGNEAELDFQVPPVGSRGIGQYFGMEGSRPPFDSRGFGRHLDMRGGPTPFDGRGFGRRHDEEKKPDDHGQK